MQIDFQALGSVERHQCQARRAGDWVVFTCSKCPGYERRMNLQTGAIKTQYGIDPTILHEGSFVPVGLEQPASLPN